MVMTVGRIPYLSCEPLYFDMERRGIALVDLVPSAVTRAIERGEIDAGPVPLVDSFRLENDYRKLSGFCVSFIHQAVSVILHTKQPIEALSGARIGITDEASTAAALLKVILSVKYEIKSVTYVTLADPNDACLLIGNAGLRQRYGMEDYPHHYDLGEEWYQWTQLPFVFARWLARSTLEPQEIGLLEESLYVGMQDWADGIFRSSQLRGDLLMDARDILTYTQGIRYFVGRPEQKSEEVFRQYLAQL